MELRSRSRHCRRDFRRSSAACFPAITSSLATCGLLRTFIHRNTAYYQYQSTISKRENIRLSGAERPANKITPQTLGTLRSRWTNTTYRNLALQVRFSRRCAIQIDVYLYLIACTMLTRVVSLWAATCDNTLSTACLISCLVTVHKYDRQTAQSIWSLKNITAHTINVALNNSFRKFIVVAGEKIRSCRCFSTVELS